MWESTATDVALNAGGPSVYLLDGLSRYRLFFRTATQIDPSQEYIAEGVYAQKAIDEIGDPDQGKSGYPLPASCDRVVRMAWPGQAMDVTDSILHGFVHQGETLSRQARIPGDPATACYIQGERRRGTQESRRCRGGRPGRPRRGG